jgi:hypothetical protein
MVLNYLDFFAPRFKGFTQKKRLPQMHSFRLIYWDFFAPRFRGFTQKKRLPQMHSFRLIYGFFCSQIKLIYAEKGFTTDAQFLFIILLTCLSKFSHSTKHNFAFAEVRFPTIAVRKIMQFVLHAAPTELYYATINIFLLKYRSSGAIIRRYLARLWRAVCQ